MSWLTPQLHSVRRGSCRMYNASQPIKNLNILAGSANPRLAERIADQLNLQLTARILERFPDGELHIEIQESVRGHDVYVVQPTCRPVDENLLELLFLADACRRAGASWRWMLSPVRG